VIETQEMQNAMDEQPDDLLIEAMSTFDRLVLRRLEGDHDVAEKRSAKSRESAFLHGKRKDVCRSVFPAVLQIQRLHAAIRDKHDAQFRPLRLHQGKETARCASEHRAVNRHTALAVLQEDRHG